MATQYPQEFIGKLVTFMAFLTLIATMLSCAAPAKSSTERSSARLTVPSDRKAAPDFALRDSKGTLLNLADYKGKVVLLDFWATYCGGCRREIPWYEQFEHRYGTDGFSAIGVAMDKSWKTVKPFMASEKMNYPVVVGSFSLLMQYRTHNLPATFLIDRDGRIAGRHIGVVNKNRFQDEIEKLLREKH